MTSQTIGRKGGLYCYVITPFKENGDVDHAVLERYVEAIIQSGADGLTCVASTTQGVYLTEQERFAVVDTVCKTANGRVPVNVGIGGFSTRQVLHYAEQAQKAGASTMMLEMQTYIMKVNFESAHKHYADVGKASDIPIRLYNIPSTTRFDMTPDQIARMSDIKQIDSIKDATGDATRVRDIRSLCGDRFSIYNGLHWVSLDSYKYGAIGWEGGFHPIIAKEMVDLHQVLSARNFDKGEIMYKRLEPLFTLFKYYGVPQCMVAMSEWSDIPLGTTRPPLLALNESQKADLKRVLINLECI